MIVAPRIVAVDDTVEHLQALRSAFGALGGLCECLEAHEAQDRQTPFLNGVRVLFMDINLLPGAGLDVSARTFSPIMAIIRKLISAENGPYALVTWTNNPNAHDALSNHLQEHLDPTLRPSATFCLSKPEYLEDGQSLIEKLKTLQNELPGLSMLLDWEAAVISAADRSVLEIMKLSEKFGLEGGAAVSEAVHAVSHAAAGNVEAKARPFRAFTNGMSAVLADRLDYRKPDLQAEAAWQRILAAANVGTPNDIQKAALNTFFHVELLSSDAPSSFGVVYDLKFSDVLPFLAGRFKSSREALLANEFLPLRGGALKTDGDKAKFARSCKWRFVRLGASCDHANNKTRVLDGVLAVEVPEVSYAAVNLHERNTFRDFPDKREWLFQTPPFKGAKGRYSIVANMRYRVGLPEASLAALKPVIRLREALASELATHAANFSTRPGIVEFR